MQNESQKSSKGWLCLLLVLLVSALGICAWLLLHSGGGAVACIYIDGVCERRIDLAAVSEPYSFVLHTEHGENTVSVEHGRISVTSADCPDGVCVKTGPIENAVQPIVCLPHRVVIRIEAASADGDTAPDVIVN